MSVGNRAETKQQMSPPASPTNRASQPQTALNFHPADAHPDPTDQSKLGRQATVRDEDSTSRVSQRLPAASPSGDGTPNDMKQAFQTQRLSSWHGAKRTEAPPHMVPPTEEPVDECEDRTRLITNMEEKREVAEVLDIIETTMVRKDQEK